jgi:Ca2+-binding EF-hand superfamily protein
MLKHIFKQGWDLDEYNIVERMWAYIALSHPEHRGMQELSVQKWTQWSADLVAQSPKPLKKTNQHVSWYFIKSVIEHAEAVLIFGRFPHRNPIMSRPHKAGEVYYLTDAMRPLWSFTQPPRPDYFTILGTLCRIDRDTSIDAVSRDAVTQLQEMAGLDPSDETSVSDVFELFDVEKLPYQGLYRHLRLKKKEPAFQAICNIPQVHDLTTQITSVILKDPNETWPPKSAKHSVPAVIDVPGMNDIVRCQSFNSGELTVTIGAVKRLVADTGLMFPSADELMSGFEKLRATEPRLFREGPDHTPMSAPLGKQGFRKLCALVFDAGDNLDKVARRLFDVIDIDYDHSITNGEALTGLSLFCPGDLTTRTSLIFEIFDNNSDGKLEQKEVHDMLRTLGLRSLHMIENLFDPYFDSKDTGMSVRFDGVLHYDEIEQDAEDVYASADTDRDGMVSREEFVRWVTRHDMMKQFIEIPNLLFDAVK